MFEDYDEKEIYAEENKGGYRISIVARLGGPGVTNIQYRIRLSEPDNPDFPIDYLPTLDGFQKLGVLLISLRELAKESRYVETPEQADAWARILSPALIQVIAEKLRSDRGEKAPAPEERAGLKG